MDSTDVACNQLQCGPIHSVNELLNWESTVCTTQCHSVSASCLTFDESLKKFVRKSRTSVTKTLVCHDMKGGYLDDSYIGGSSNSEAYSFTQWNIIDTFVYFSHHFVTIPPPCWIHAGHLHGVSVLGTLITEWESGSDICKTIFDNQGAVDVLVDKLSSITVHYNFDGWLINIENPIAPDKIANVIYFLRKLKLEMLQRGKATAQVIWYDSITKSGELKWQNELNEENRLFFEACDGIFLNYTWNIECLTRSLTEAKNRPLDVYVGIDVFGRNCYGGGGFNTNAALSVVRQYGLSAAIFAPGWVYECHDIGIFPSINTEFWLLLLPYLSVKGLNRLPIETSFCPGFGKAKFRCGKILRKNPWFDMRQQQLQPYLCSIGGLVSNSLPKHFPLNEVSTEELKFGNTHLPFGCQSIDTDDAYNGGGCLVLQSLEAEAIFPLFFCDIRVDGAILLAVALKDIQENVKIFLVLTTSEVNASGVLRLNQISVSLNTEENFIDENNYEKYYPLSNGRFIASEANTSWMTRMFKLFLKDTIITGISLVVNGPVKCKVGFFSCFQFQEV